LHEPPCLEDEGSAPERVIVRKKPKLYAAQTCCGVVYENEDGPGGDQGVHEADIMFMLQVETAAIGVLKLETSRGKEVPK